MKKTVLGKITPPSALQLIDQALAKLKARRDFIDERLMTDTDDKESLNDAIAHLEGAAKLTEETGL